MKRKQDVNDEDAASALRYGGKSGAVATHDAMQQFAEEADDDNPDPNGDWDEEDWAAYEQRN
jgi:hypothetical protein